MSLKNNIETATLSLGWFWGPDAKFGHLNGVISTRVGYCGGKKLNPTYRDLVDHTETIQIDFDINKLSYKEILNMFWKNHNSTRQPYSTQYKSTIFYANELQKSMALDMKKDWENDLKTKIYTEILPLSTFYYAELYHQKYYLQLETALAMEIRNKYTSAKEFINSTEAARLNSYIAGYGTVEDIKDSAAKFNWDNSTEKLILLNNKSSDSILNC